MKKDRKWWFSFLASFAKLVEGESVIGVFTTKLMFKCYKPNAREADVRAISIVKFINGTYQIALNFFPIPFSKYLLLEILDETIFWWWGLLLKTLANKAHTPFSYWLSLHLFIKAKFAHLSLLIVLYWSPCLYKSEGIFP